MASKKSAVFVVFIFAIHALLSAAVASPAEYLGNSSLRKQMDVAALTLDGTSRATSCTFSACLDQGETCTMAWGYCEKEHMKLYPDYEGTAFMEPAMQRCCTARYECRLASELCDDDGDCTQEAFLARIYMFNAQGRTTEDFCLSEMTPTPGNTDGTW